MTITKKALENPNDGYFERVYKMLDDLEKDEDEKDEAKKGVPIHETGKKRLN